MLETSSLKWGGGMEGGGYPDDTAYFGRFSRGPGRVHCVRPKWLQLSRLSPDPQCGYGATLCEAHLGPWARAGRGSARTPRLFDRARTPRFFDRARTPRLVKTPVLRTSGLIGRYCCKHTNEDMSLNERVHARFFLKGVTISAKECFIATFEAVIQSAFVLTANNHSILVLLSVPLASAAQIFGRLKAVL